MEAKAKVEVEAEEKVEMKVRWREISIDDSIWVGGHFMVV